MLGSTEEVRAFVVIHLIFIYMCVYEGEKWRETQILGLEGESRGFSLDVYIYGDTYIYVYMCVYRGAKWRETQMLGISPDTCLVMNLICIHMYIRVRIEEKNGGKLGYWERRRRSTSRLMNACLVMNLNGRGGRDACTLSMRSR